jgi:hypothetical protein
MVRPAGIGHMPENSFVIGSVDRPTRAVGEETEYKIVCVIQCNGGGNRQKNKVKSGIAASYVLQATLSVTILRWHEFPERHSRGVPVAGESRHESASLCSVGCSAGVSCAGDSAN